MLTVKLSSVITGWGGNDTTRSRRSTRARILSTNGSSKVSCPDTVLLYRPSRSITAASACGISAIDLATMMAANTTSTPTSTKPAIAPSITGFLPLCVQASLDFLDHRRCAVDVHDGHVVAGFVDLILVQRPRRPDFSVEFYLAFMAGHPIEHQCALSFERLRRLRKPSARSEVSP